MKRIFLLSALIVLSGSAAFAEDAATLAPAGTAPLQETLWLDDELPANAKEEGNWLWDTATVASGSRSHGHPSAKGLQSHGFTADPAQINVNSMVTQQVWLDPQDPPRGIMLKFRLAGGEEVGVYWEGEEEVFSPGEEEEVWYYGLLPELGKWTTVEVLAEDLGLEEDRISGVSFVTFDGRALWDKTLLTQAPAAEEVGITPGE
ncbi:MAG: hypothetical protein HYZ90_04205 [Candidatus Omnitrophica bacterium]|nr:hypothetical protein [Candidatus Omnitrophota bacterium]